MPSLRNYLSAAGYRLVIHANRSIDAAQALAKELSTNGPESIALAADLCDERSIEQMIDQAH